MGWQKSWSPSSPPPPVKLPEPKLPGAPFPAANRVGRAESHLPASLLGLFLSGAEWLPRRCFLGQGLPDY